MHTCVYTYTCVCQAQDGTPGWGSETETSALYSPGQNAEAVSISASLRHMWCDLTQCLVHSKGRPDHVSCHFMCSSDWHFVSWSQPIRLKMPSSGVVEGTSETFPALHWITLSSPWSKQKTLLCLSSLLTRAKIDSGSEIWFHHLSKPSTPGEVQELFSL